MVEDNDGRGPGVIESTSRPFYGETRRLVPAASLSVPCPRRQWLGLGFVGDKVKATIVPGTFARPDIDKGYEGHSLSPSLMLLSRTGLFNSEASPMINKGSQFELA